LSSAVLPALRRGSLLVLSDDAGPWGPLAAARALGATVFPTVPVYLHAIASLADPPPWPETIRRVISAGATLRPETAARFREVYGPCAHVFYGASESGGICYDRTGDAALRGTVGTPLDGVRVDIEEGAVRVRSEAVGLGYVPAAKASLRDGRFVTADLGAWTADGELELLGRADAMINAGGKKVQPAEVESVLRAMPGVRDVVVFGVPCGVGEREIVRAVIACDTGRIAYVEVTAWCRDRLAAHKVPRSIVFVEVIPRTPRGKIDRAALDAAEPVLE
jgi:long-chain acyl-CoA synthetase